MIVLLQSHKKSELFLYEFNVYISNQLDILSLSFCLYVLCIVLLCEQMFFIFKKEYCVTFICQQSVELISICIRRLECLLSIYVQEFQINIWHLTELIWQTVVKFIAWRHILQSHTLQLQDISAWHFITKVQMFMYIVHLFKKSLSFLFSWQAEIFLQISIEI